LISAVSAQQKNGPSASFAGGFFVALPHPDASRGKAMILDCGDAIEG